MVQGALNRSHRFRKWKMTSLTFPKVTSGPELPMFPHMVPGWVVEWRAVHSLVGDQGCQPSLHKPINSS